MNDQRPTPTNEQIIKALTLTGFMFEQKAAGILGDAETGWAYKDPDTGTSREIDLIKSGFAHFGTPDNRRARVTWTVIGECKNYQWPWIALTKPWNRPRWEIDSSHIAMTVPASVLLGVDREPLPVSLMSPFSQSYYENRISALPRAVQLLKLNKKSGGWDASSDNIFNDITYPLAKASDYLIKRFLKANTLPRRQTSTRVELFFPVLVVSSDIYAVTPSDNPTVEPINMATLVRTLESETVQGTYHIDIVHIDHLNSWYSNKVLRVAKETALGLGMQPKDGADFF